jgi:hypothetical protein
MERAASAAGGSRQQEAGSLISAFDLIDLRLFGGALTHQKCCR